MLHLNGNASVRSSRGKHLLMIYEPEAAATASLPQRVLEVNHTFADFWKCFEGKDFTQEEVAVYLARTYGIDEETAATDARRLIRELQSNRLIDES